MAEMSEREQEAFAAYLRARLPPPLHLFVLTAYAARVLERPGLLHWRSLSAEEARVVMTAARTEFAPIPPATPAPGA